MALLAPTISFNSSDFSISGIGGGTNTTDSTYRYGYAVYKRPVGGGSLTLLTKVYTDATTFNLSLYGLVTAVCEIIVVQFQELVSNGTFYALSSYSNYVVISLPPIRPPSTLSYDPITNTLSWSGASGGISSYKIYQSYNNYYSLISTVTTTVTSGSLVLDGLFTLSSDLMVRTVGADGSISSDSDSIYVVAEDTLLVSAYSIITTNIKSIITTIKSNGKSIRSISRNILSNFKVSNILSRRANKNVNSNIKANSTLVRFLIWAKNISTSIKSSIAMPSRNIFKKLLINTKTSNVLKRSISRKLIAQTKSLSTVYKGYFKSLLTQIKITAIRQMIPSMVLYFKNIIVNTKISNKVPTRNIYRKVVTIAKTSNKLIKFFLNKLIVVTTKMQAINLKTIIFGGVLFYKTIVTTIKTNTIVNYFKRLFSATKKAPLYQWKEISFKYNMTECQEHYSWKELE